MAEDESARVSRDLQDIIAFENVSLRVGANVDLGAVELTVIAGQARGTLALSPPAAGRLVNAVAAALEALPLPELGAPR